MLGGMEIAVRIPAGVNAKDNKTNPTLAEKFNKHNNA